MEARADGEFIYCLLLLTDIVDAFFSPKIDFFLPELCFNIYVRKKLAFSASKLLLYRFDLRSDPAKSTMFRNDWHGLPSLFLVFILI